jgi:hypothetical protein
MQVRGLDPGPWRLLMVLCGFVGKRDYRVWPSFATMAERAEISRPSAKRFVALLIERNLIEQVDVRWRENGGRSVNEYRICVGEIDMTEEDHEEEDDYISERDPRVKLNRGQGHSCDPGPRVTGEPCREPLLDRTSIIEDSPLSLTGEHPPKDLLGDAIQPSTALTVIGHPNGTIIEHVAKGWNALADDFSRIPRVRVWSDARKKLVAKRASEVVRASDGVLTAYQVWDMVFQAIRNDPWLRGEAQPGRNHDRAFVIEIDHVLRAGGNPNFTRILERATTNDNDRRATINPATGREFGPAEQATRNALARLRAGRGGGS